jgi:hypothetical protein
MKPSLCMHLDARSMNQPWCSITDNGRESWACMSCFAETIGTAMNGKEGVGPGTVAGRVSFKRCDHGRPESIDACNPCFRGCLSMLQATAALAHFSDKPFANRLRAVANVITARHMKGQRETDE